LVNVDDYTSLKAAIATGNSVLIPTTTSSIAVDAADVSDVLVGLSQIRAEHDVTLTLAAGTHTVSTGNIANVGQNQNIFIQGATPVATTLSSVDTVTGSAGNWTVTATLASTTGIAIGDVVKIDNVTPGRVYFPTTVGDRRPASNEMAIGIYAMGEVTTTTGGTTVNLTKSVASSFLQPGDLVTIRGETRVVDTVGTNSFTVTSGFTYGLVSYQWWYYHIPNAGTVTATASATVTGTSTLFTTEANIGDLLVVDGCSYKIVGITNDTSLTVSHAVTIPAGSKYTIVTAGILHQGSFIVTNVSGSQITYTSKARYVPTLPTKKVSGGTVNVLKTVLRNTGTGNGFVFNRGAVIGNIKNVAIVGNNLSTTSDGIKLNNDPTGDSGSYDLGSSVANLGANVSVINWGFGATLQSGCTLFAKNGHFCNNLTRGVSNEDGSTSYLREAVVSHNNGIGIFAGGGYVRGSEAVVCANNLQGLRINVGNGSYGDAWYAWGNGSHGFLAEGGCGIHFVDSYSNCNGGNGGNFQNGASGRISRTWFGGNENYALSSTNCLVEGGQIWCSGTWDSSYGGVNASRGNIDLNYSAQTGNVGIGIYAQAGTRCYAEYTFQSRNNLQGIRADDFSTAVTAYNSSSVNNGSANSSTDGGVLSIPDSQYGEFRMSSHFTQSFSIANDAVASLNFGATAVIRTIYLHSSSSAALQGAVRIRTVSSLGTTSIYGTGFTMNDYGTNPTGVLTGTTGTGGNVTLSAADDGKFYIENRSGGTRVIIIDVMGS
jgi:hypothetical protein